MSFAPDFFFPKKMKLEDQKQIEILMEDVICSEASLIMLKNRKLMDDKKYEREKADLETNLKSIQHRIAILTGIEEEVEKEYQRWKNLTSEEKMKEHKERIDILREAEKNNWYGKPSSP